MKSRRWVVKAGSEMLFSGGLSLVQEWMKQVAQIQSQNQIEVIWVTSGAIAYAKARTSYTSAKPTLKEKQALSAIGQPVVMDLYNKALTECGLQGAQVLLTASDMRSPSRRKNLQNTLEQLLAWKTLPILNENDAVATEEIQFGDNDRLSALIAEMMGAERLLLLTDVEGLYDRDPKGNPSAQQISHLKRVTKKELALAADPASSSGRGRGGMLSKLIAAQKASRAGVITHFIKGDSAQALPRLAAGEVFGTTVASNKRSARTPQ